MQKTINGAMLRSMILTAAKLLEINRVQIDALNVFPVPDGDTGTNMSLTFQSAVKELINCQSNKIESIAEAVSKGALRGARGNSGVILSQVLRGFCNTLKKAEEIDTKLFAQALMSGAEIAYGAVSKPKEGTMLTVARMVAEHAQSVRSKCKDFESFLPELISAGNDAVELTPTLLPVLKKAGVVDAGGKGLMCLYEGMLKAFNGESVGAEPIIADDNSGDSVMDHADIMSLGNIEFAYCTEFFIINLKKKTTLADIERLRETLMSIGDSVIVIGDLEFVKVHVHTNQPGRALSEALELGELDKLKIENMLEQNRALMKKYEEEKKEMGMLAISAGDGITSIFKDLMVDAVVEGGQSMNPSANDIANAVQRINADNVFVFPNNKNIIMSAEQANDITDKNLIVIPTKSIPQGISAVLAFDANSSIEENKENMNEVISAVRSGSVTYAVRTTNVDGIDVTVGDIMGLDEHSVLTTGKEVSDTTVELIGKLVTEDSCNITLFYGEGVTEEDASNLQSKLEEKFPSIDVSMVFGGQPVYYYIISVE